MSLPNSYAVKTGAMQSYFDAILNAEAPDRFSQKFLESLDFKSKNDRLIIGVLKELGFLNPDGVPTQRYFDYLDKSNSRKVIAEGIRDMYSDLFNVNKDAQKMTPEQVEGKLKSLYAGAKTSSVIKCIARTFNALVQLADFSQNIKSKPKLETTDELNSFEQSGISGEVEQINEKMKFGSLQYHINIVLPESRDQAVYDAIFKSLKNHL